MRRGGCALRRAAALLGLVGLLGSKLACVSQPTLAAQHPWLEVSAPHFLVRSEVDREQTIEIAQRLEQFRAAAHDLTGVEWARNSPVSRVYIFASKRSFDPYRRHQRKVAGYTIARPHAPYVALVADAGDDTTFRIAYHEYVHLLMRHSPIHVPLWYEEGLAEVLESFRVVEGMAEVGHPNAHFLAELKYARWKSKPSILGMNVHSPNYVRSFPSFHSQAWGWAHFFMFGDPKRLAQLEGYLARWNRGESPEPAFEASFGADYASLWREVVAHLRAKEFRFGDFPVAQLGADNPLDVRSLPIAETYAALGDLLIQIGPWGIAQAEALFRTALTHSPDLALPHAGIALALDQVGRYEEALRHLEIAIEHAPLDLQVRLLSGDHAFRVARPPKAASAPHGPGSTLRILAEARRQYRMAALLHPGNPDTLQRVGMTFLYDSENVEQGVALLQPVVRRWDRHRGLAETLARLYLKAGRSDAARRVLARVMRTSPGSEATTEWLDIIEQSPAEALDFDTLLARLGARPTHRPASVPASAP